jgi:hypothetical protein
MFSARDVSTCDRSPPSENKCCNGDMDMEYSDITCPVPASPSAGSQRPKTRFRARMDSLVIPERAEPCTDISSKKEDDSGIGTCSRSTCPEW